MIQETQVFTMDRTVTTSRMAALALTTTLLLSACASNGETEKRQEILRLNQQALEAEMEEDDEQARIAYRELLELDPARPRAWFQLGNIEARAGELAAARDAFVNALETDPDYHEARYNLGLMHLREGAELLDEARDELPEDATSYATDVYISCLLARIVRNPDIDIPCPDLP